MFACGLPWLCVWAALHASCGAYGPDEVASLPGMRFRPGYGQWSGYLQTRPGRFFHYW